MFTINVDKYISQSQGSFGKYTVHHLKLQDSEIQNSIEVRHDSSMNVHIDVVFKLQNKPVTMCRNLTVRNIWWGGLEEFHQNHVNN